MSGRRPLVWAAVATLVPAVLLAAGEAARAATYDVGPGQANSNIGDVPLESLGAGDEVVIHWRDTPYREKFVVGGTGNAGAPIVIRGVLGPGGERPIIDGEDAVTRPQLDYWNQVREVIKVGGSSSPPDAPSYITIENLDIRGGRPPAGFTDAAGTAQAYADNAAAIFIEDGDHITVRNCILRDSSNGLFAASGSSDVLVEGSYLHDNGNVGDIYVHNNYTEALRITFQYNRFGPLCPACDGNNLKDRSAGLVVRYNWIEGGNRQLDLVDTDYFAAEPDYVDAFVYGNVLVEPDGAGNRQIVHWGGDSGNEPNYRAGTLYFYNNTIVSTRADRTTIFRISTNAQHVDMRNNIVHATAGGDTISLVDQDGMLDMGANWIGAGYVDTFGTLGGTIGELQPQVTGTDPGFADLTGQDFGLTASSPARDGAMTLAAGVPPVDREYRRHQQGADRASDGMLDIGAFEHCQSGNCTTSAPDAGLPGGDAGPGNDAAEPRDAAGPVGGDGGGCDCRAASDGAGEQDGGGAVLLLLVAAGALLRRMSKV